MSFNRKLIRNGNSWAMCINMTILRFLDVNPESDMVNYVLDKDKLIITKSSKTIENKKNDTP